MSKQEAEERIRAVEEFLGLLGAATNDMSNPNTIALGVHVVRHADLFVEIILNTTTTIGTSLRFYEAAKKAGLREG